MKKLVDRSRLLPLVVKARPIFIFPVLLQPSATTTTPPLPRTIARRRADPLPGPPHLAIAALALTDADIAIQLYDGADALPDLLALAEGVDGPQDVVAEVRQEQPRVVVDIVAGDQALLVGEAVQDQVDQGRDPGREGAVGAQAPAGVEERQGEADHCANLDSIARQSEADGSADRARDGKASERGGREVGVWKGSGIGISKGAVGFLVSLKGKMSDKMLLFL